MVPPKATLPSHSPPSLHGYLDQVGQATAPDGDPAYVFKQFGRDIANAVREELLP